MNRTQTLKYSKRGKRVPSSESFGVVLKVTNLLISSVTSFPSAPNSQTSLIYVLSWGEDSRGSEGKVPPFISSYNRRVYIIPGDLSVPPTLFSGSEPRRTTTCSLDWKKKQLKGSHFSSVAEVIAATETRLDGQTSDFFLMACKS